MKKIMAEARPRENLVSNTSRDKDKASASRVRRKD